MEVQIGIQLQLVEPEEEVHSMWEVQAVSMTRYFRTGPQAAEVPIRAVVGEVPGTVKPVTVVPASSSSLSLRRRFSRITKPF